MRVKSRTLNMELDAGGTATHDGVNLVITIPISSSDAAMALCEHIDALRAPPTRSGSVLDLKVAAQPASSPPQAKAVFPSPRGDATEKTPKQELTQNSLSLVPEELMKPGTGFKAILQHVLTALPDGQRAEKNVLAVLSSQPWAGTPTLKNLTGSLETRMRDVLRLKPDLQKLIEGISESEDEEDEDN